MSTDIFSYVSPREVLAHEGTLKNSLQDEKIISG
jgi:hypothetical protein